MSAIDAEPKIIDREAERDTFGRLIELEADARVLTLRDQGGQGKSSLLQVLRHNCLGRPTPVALVELTQLKEHTPLGFVKQLRRDLGRTRLSFPEFDKLNTERIRGTPPDMRPSIEVSATVEAGSAQESELVGVQYIDQRPAAAGERVLSKEELDDLVERSIEVFFAELAAHCEQRLTVIMIDAYDRGGREIRDWLLTSFLVPYCFDVEQRPARLAVVVAGRQVPPCEGVLGAERYGRLVVEIPSLSPLEDTHIRQLFDERGVVPSDAQVTAIREALENGMPIKDALVAIQLFGGRRADA